MIYCSSTRHGGTLVYRENNRFLQVIFTGDANFGPTRERI